MTKKYLKMKKIAFTLVGLFVLFACLNAQYNKVITVPSGTKIIDKFPPSVRYFYPDFSEGSVVLKNGTANKSLLNLNVLTGEIEFIQDKDTMAIRQNVNLSMVLIRQDTFIYRGEFFRRIHGRKPVILERDAINLKEIVRMGAMGQPNRTSAVESYNTMNYKSNMYAINPDADMEFRRELEFFVLMNDGELVQLRKKTVTELYPWNVSEIQKFMKSNKTNFEKRESILQLAEFLSGL